MVDLYIYTSVINTMPMASKFVSALVLGTRDSMDPNHPAIGSRILLAIAK